MQSNNSSFTSGANALQTPLQLTQTLGVIAGTGSIEFAGNATAAFSLQNNGNNRAITNYLSGGAVLTFSTNPIQLSENNTVGRTFTLFGSGATVISAPILNTAGASTFASNFVYSPSSSASTLSITGISTNVLASGWTGTANFNGGTTTLSGAGTFGAGGVGLVTVANTGILTLDNVTTNTGTRLGDRPIALNGATLNFIGHSAGTTEGSAANTTSILTVGGGVSTLNLTNNGGTTQLNLASLTTNTGASSTSLPTPSSVRRRIG